jgi:3-oxoacyl-[acyl-carrier protein] reductase
MDLGLEGKVAIVTGSARGLGAATAQRLAAEGARVVVTDINREGAEASAAALRAQGFTAHCVTGDITRQEDVQRLVDETVATFGTVHILVNNAGFPRDSRITKMSEADWDLVVDVILKGSFLACKAVMPLMIEQRWGRIVNISSRAHLGNPGQANYSAAKAGILGLTRALALEEGRYDITVNAVAPGFIETEMVQSLPNYDAIKERTIKNTPIQRVGRPTDIADAVAFLASERASFITGETLHVTGGRYSS